MFKKIGAQKVSHSDNFQVQVLDRFNVEYIDATQTATVAVDFGLTVGVYENSLRVRSQSGVELSLGNSERSMIVE